MDLTYHFGKSYKEKKMKISNQVKRERKEILCTHGWIEWTDEIFFFRYLIIIYACFKGTLTWTSALAIWKEKNMKNTLFYFDFFILLSLPSSFCSYPLNLYLFTDTLATTRSALCTADHILCIVFFIRRKLHLFFLLKI